MEYLYLTTNRRTVAVGIDVVAWGILSIHRRVQFVGSSTIAVIKNFTLATAICGNKEGRTMSVSWAESDNYLAQYDDNDRVDHVFRYMEYGVLTDWERGFVESVEEYYNDKGYVTVKQMKTLERVFSDAAER